MPRADDPPSSTDSSDEEEEDSTTEDEEETTSDEESSDEEETETTTNQTGDTSTGNGTTTTGDTTSTTQETTTESTAATTTATTTTATTAPVVNRDDGVRRSVSFAANQAQNALPRGQAAPGSDGTTESRTTTTTTEEEEEESTTDDEESTDDEEEESSDEEEEEEEEETETSTAQTTETTATSTQASTAKPAPKRSAASSSSSTGETSSTTTGTTTTGSSTVDRHSGSNGRKPTTAAKPRAGEASPSTTERSSSSHTSSSGTGSSSTPTTSSKPTTSEAQRPSTISSATTTGASSVAAATVGKQTKAETAGPTPKPPPPKAAPPKSEGDKPAAEGGKKSAKGWNKARAAATGNEVSPEAAAKAAEAARHEGAPSPPSQAAPSAGGASEKNTVAHPAGSSGTSDPGAQRPSPTGPTDTVGGAKPRYGNHPAESSSSSTSSGSSDEEDSEEDEEGTVQEGTTSTSTSTPRAPQTTAGAAAAVPVPLREGQPNEAARPAEKPSSKGVEIRGTVVVDAAVAPPRPPPVACPSQLLASSASAPVATLLSAINGEGVNTREDLQKAARVIGLSGRDFINVEVRRGERIAAPDAAKLLEAQLIKITFKKLRSAFAKLDAFGSGEVSDRDLQRLLGNVKGFSTDSDANATLTLSFVDRRLVVTANDMTQPAEIGFADLYTGRLMLDTSNKAWFKPLGDQQPQLPLFGASDGSPITAAFAQMQFVAQCFENSRFEDGNVDYHRFLDDALVAPHETADHTSAGVAAVTSHVLALPQALKKPLLDDASGMLEPFLWKPYRDATLRESTFTPAIVTENGQPHVAMRTATDTARFTRVLVLETVSVHPYLINPFVCLEAGVSCFALVSIIRAGDDICPPVKLPALPLKDDAGTWKFQSKKFKVLRPGSIFIQADAADIVYVEYCLQLPTHSTPLSVGFSTLEAANLEEVPANESVPIAMWVNGGSFYHRQKPVNRTAGRPRGGCCASQEANDCLAVGQIEPLPSRLLTAANDLDQTRLRLLPRVCVLRLHHVHFLLSYLHQLFLAQQTEPVYMVLRQDPFRALAEIVRDADGCDLAAALWNDMAVGNQGVLKDQDAVTRRCLVTLAADLLGTVQVGGVEQRWKRHTASKGEAEAKVAVLETAPLRPSVAPLASLAAHAR